MGRKRQKSIAYTKAAEGMAKVSGSGKPLISGRSYAQARIYARGRGYGQFDFVTESHQIMGLRGFDITLEALPGTPDLVLLAARVQDLNVKKVAV